MYPKRAAVNDTAKIPILTSGFVIPTDGRTAEGFKASSSSVSCSIFCFCFSSEMAIRQVLKRSLSSEKRSNSTGPADVPKGYCAVYVGESECKQRFVIPVSYLNHASFQDLLCQAEEEYGFYHPMGGLTIPYSEDLFVGVTSRLSRI